MIPIFGRGRVFGSARKVSFPHTLKGSGIFIFPTRHGFLFILILMGMLLGSANYNNNLGFLLTFLLGSMVFVSILHTHRNLSGIEIGAAEPQPVFVGGRAICRIRIGGGFRARTAIDFGFTGASSVCRSFSAGSDTRVEVGMKTSQRGVLSPGFLIVATRFPLGLFRAWSRFDSGVEWTVYPAPMAGAEAFRRNGLENSPRSAENSDSPGVEDFGGLRYYQPGDPLQHISWKSHARGQRLMTKTFTGQKGDTRILDWHLLKEDGTERKLSMLTGMVLDADRSGLRYGLDLPGKTIPPGRGEAHKHECLRTLALFGYPGGYS
jgi:uncharacterized protein (DUF58 family)